MTEDFLHYIWKLRLFKYDNLSTQSGEKVEIITPGDHNTDAGPDFFNSKIKIDKTLWAGNVEIHVNSKDWLLHSHQNNDAYDNVILHVVYEDGTLIKRQDGSCVPTIELKNYIDNKIWERYQHLINNQYWIPCEKQIGEIDQITINNWINRLTIERLERKSTEITDALHKNNNNWEDVFYHILARNFGLKINSLPFELLAKALPISCLAKHKNNLFQIEALLFGTAGLLNDNFNDTYPNQLKKEYEYLKKKFKLLPVDAHLWKFLRLRPLNFPTIRIAQFAQLVYHSSHLFSKVLECKKINEIERLFNISTTEYWETHYIFDESSLKKNKKVGKMALQNIIINTIVPFMFVYGNEKQLDVFKERALAFLEALPAEKNNIISKWDSLEITSKSAFETQALLQLKNQYCTFKKCLQCAIGNKILRRKV